MNFKKMFLFSLFFAFGFILCKSANSQNDVTGDYSAVPYFSDMKVKFYVASPASLFYTFDLVPEYANFPIPFGGAGPNATAIYDGKLFISFDKDQVQGGVLIYNYSDIYPVRSANSPVIISTASVAGIAIHPVTGDLYVAKFYTGSNSGKITRYTKATGYSTASAYDLPVPNGWVNYFTGIAFDDAGNLWTGNLDEHKVLCFTASSLYDNFYVIENGAGTYPALNLSGGSVNVKLFSAPEGFAFDNVYNLWVTNNNDWARTNNPGEGTFLKINKSFISFLLTQPVSGTRGNPNVAVMYTVPAASANVYFLQNAKFGGLAFRNNVLYLNDQGNLNIWKWDISSVYNNTNYVFSGINTTYPGFGGISFNDNTFPFGVKSISETIPEKYELKQNYPNPFNPVTKIRFNIPNHASMQTVSLIIYNSLGQSIETLLNGKMSAGTYEATWSADKYPSGVYFYKLVVGESTNNRGITETKKMILIK